MGRTVSGRCYLDEAQRWGENMAGVENHMLEGFEAEGDRRTKRRPLCGELRKPEDIGRNGPPSAPADRVQGFYLG